MIRKNQDAAFKIAKHIANEAAKDCGDGTTRAEAEIDALFGALTDEIERRLDMHDEIKRLNDLCNDLEYEVDQHAGMVPDLRSTARKVLLEVHKIVAGLTDGGL